MCYNGGHLRHSKRQRPTQLLQQLTRRRQVSTVAVQWLLIGFQGARPKHATRDEPCPAEEEQYSADDIAEYHEPKPGLRPPKVNGTERIDFGQVSYGSNSEL